MQAAQIRTVGKTPTMAFVLDYLREFPGAQYRLVKKAALSHGLPAPATIVYGNAVRVLKIESDRTAEPRATAPASPASRMRRRGRAARGITDLANLVERMQEVMEERDRLREAVEQIAQVFRSLRR